VRIAKFPPTVRSKRSCEGVNSQGAKNQAIAYRHSAVGKVRVYPLKSRVAISRFNGSRRSERGQVARDPVESAKTLQAMLNQRS
jgi:hypothetical protein